ncbi:MAG: hypothetical protein IT579_22495 [Verrucomicrobia subdivision 3 bacterium]|nr:hypothetical protein [Verrucomicrobiota bacterium]MCC6823505.1 hypothetical protein [Limisphaerales bacterium]
MKNSNSTGSPVMGFSPWQQLKSKRISYLTLPLLVMATVVEFVILATGWKYQQIACLPQGMGVTFFGIGPIGATILAVELLKLPLAIWTASRTGWQKGFMLVVGLPLICVLTFQLVKDMGVYEMSTAMTPASQLLEKASAEETKITQLNGDLTAIEGKKADRERKLAELTAKKAKARAELEESIKRNQDARQDAISLTDYQKKELSEVEARQATIIKQFDADTAQLTKAITELRARRETEVPRATKWNAEEARIDNTYKAKLAAYTNKKSAYEKDKKEYESANVLKRQLMREPVDPGVPPERESNTILKPTLVADIDAQIKVKEDELAAVNNKRRDRVAQVDADARRVREEFDRRSSAKREESDRKREELSAALAALATEWKVEEKQIDEELGAAVQKVDGIRAELDAARKKAEGFYEARETAIRNTQVHRIATTVEIVRGLIKGERPMSIKATAKERGDILTDQISMVRIWVYPVLAFIVAFLPTLMVELGFSTLFHRDEQRRPYRLGFFGRRMHWLYKRAGRVKILRAERLAREATAAIALRDKALATATAVHDRALAAEIAARDEALATATANAEKVLAAKEAELQVAHEAIGAAAADLEQQLKQKEGEWVAKFSGVADSLSRAITENDALRALQKSEIDRQVQLRQNAWSDRLTQLRQELDAQHAAHEGERTAMVQQHQKKLLEVSEECKNQVMQARRQKADAELAVEETSAKLAYQLKEAVNDRDEARSELQQQVESLALKLTQAKEDAAREMEKATRQEKHRFERQQAEFVKTLRQRDEEFERQLKQREQELSLGFDARLAEEKSRVDEEARHREAELERQLDARVREVDARWNQEVQQREEAAQTRLKQREQQLQAQAEILSSDLQTQAAQELRRRDSELERQLESQSREADTRFKQELQKKELAFQSKLKQREQELTARAAARETELQNQAASDLRVREEEWARQTEARVRATETRLGQEAQQKEEILQIKIRQREQQLQSQFDARQAELQGQTEHFQRRRELESADAGQRALRELEAQLRQEMQQKEETVQTKAKLREQELLVQLTAQAEAHQLAARQWETELETMRSHLEPFSALLARTEKERDEARQAASEGARQVQELEKKLMGASSLLTGWKNGKSSVTARVGRDVLQVAPIGSGSSSEQ